ncbi:stage III sporulation protein AG [Bacillus sp. JCM 19046]|nr:stage III sporulation protein AG [Bacillus sp. JCM 19046]
MIGLKNGCRNNQIKKTLNFAQIYFTPRRFRHRINDWKSIFQPDSNDMPVTSSEEDIEATPTFAREAEKDSMADYEIRYENQLRETLEEIIGVNDVSVSVNLAESEKNIYEKNVRSGNQTTSETDREGGTRKVEDFQDEENVVIVREVIKKKRWSYRRKNQR